MKDNRSSPAIYPLVSPCPVPGGTGEQTPGLWPVPVPNTLQLLHVTLCTCSMWDLTGTSFPAQSHVGFPRLHPDRSASRCCSSTASQAAALQAPLWAPAWGCSCTTRLQPPPWLQWRSASKCFLKSSPKKSVIKARSVSECFAQAQLMSDCSCSGMMQQLKR